MKSKKALIVILVSCFCITSYGQKSTSAEFISKYDRIISSPGKLVYRDLIKMLSYYPQRGSMISLEKHILYSQGKSDAFLYLMFSKDDKWIAKTIAEEDLLDFTNAIRALIHETKNFEVSRIWRNRSGSYLTPSGIRIGFRQDFNSTDIGSLKWYYWVIDEEEEMSDTFIYDSGPNYEDIEKFLSSIMKVMAE